MSTVIPSFPPPLFPPSNPHIFTLQSRPFTVILSISTRQSPPSPLIRLLPPSNPLHVTSVIPSNPSFHRFNPSISHTRDLIGRGSTFQRSGDRRDAGPRHTREQHCAELLYFWFRFCFEEMMAPRCEQVILRQESNDSVVCARVTDSAYKSNSLFRRSRVGIMSEVQSRQRRQAKFGTDIRSAGAMNRVEQLRACRKSDCPGSTGQCFLFPVGEYN
jgi:hypothetical protein